MEEPVLRLPDLSKPFEVHIDASDFAISGVLMEDGHPLVFKSGKLNDTELRMREGLLHDPQAKTLLELVKDGKTGRFWLDDGVLYATGKLLKECHDSKWARHPGTHQTLALMSEAYY
ncbi:hypothetical protein L3X38_018501 [Prunus dulcis]|uniref:Reverse transcriptase/retrotransposon-derived protein RNase H-like domain-containing protein n=1 Tax=Prunus dulcis TaxID=3755 RepID=A0AAD4WAX6_PRUDU|nr:hypothetical protein L3X38_018501 [Prunus dulcis]